MLLCLSLHARPLERRKTFPINTPREAVVPEMTPDRWIGSDK